MFIQNWNQLKLIALCLLEIDNMENEAQGDLLPEKLSIRQYLDEKLMPTLLPALNELAKEK